MVTNMPAIKTTTSCYNYQSGKSNNGFEAATIATFAFRYGECGFVFAAFCTEKIGVWSKVLFNK